MTQDFDFPGMCGASACYTSDMNIDCQRAVNFMPERVESPSRKAEFVMRPTPGYVLERDFGKPLRGVFKASDQSLFACAGFDLWRRRGGEWELVGTVGDGTAPVSMADDSVAMLLVDGFHAWRVPLNPGEGELNVQRLERPGGGHDGDIFIYPKGCAVVGYYTVIFGREMDSPDERTFNFYVSAPLDNSRFPAADFYAAVSLFGEIRAVAAAGGLLWLLGADGAEAWETTGNSNSPFNRVSGMVFSGCGLLGSRAFASNGDSLFWLGQGGKGNGVAYLAAAGAAPKRVSAIPIEEEWRGYDDLAEAMASSHASGGHQFYLLSFPRSRKTWVYDAAAGLWHERQSGPAGKRRMWDPAILEAAGQETYGANPDGKLYRLESPGKGECGEPVLRRRTSPAVDTKERRAVHRALTVSMQAGTGDIKLMLRCSDDNGYTWGATRTLTLGKTGQYSRIAQFRGLGMARRRVYELEASDPVGVSIVRANIAVEIMGARS